MQNLNADTIELSVIETSVVTEVLTELQRALTKYPEPWGTPGNGGGYDIVEDQVEKLYTAIVEHPEDVRKYAVRTAAMALRFLCDLRPNLKEAVTPEIEQIATTLGVDPQVFANAQATAGHTGKPAIIPKANGTKHHILPLGTARFVTDAPLPVGSVTVAARGPMHHDEDEIGFGQPYDSKGG